MLINLLLEGICVELDDELGDIMSKARDRKDSGQTDLAESIEMTLEDVVRIENYE